MPAIKAQRVPKDVEPIEDTIARFCYYFPQYNFQQARQLPYKRITQMLRIAVKEQAREMWQLTQVVAAPHVKGGKGVSKMLEYFKGIIEGK